VELERDMQFGIMVNREQALDIAKWMLDKIKIYEKTTSKKEGEQQ